MLFQLQCASFILRISAQTVTIIISHAHVDHYRIIIFKNLLDILDGQIKTILVGGDLSDYPPWIQNSATNKIIGDTDFFNDKEIKFELL